MERGLFDPFLLTKLRVSLISNKDRVNSFLKDIQIFFGDYGCNNRFAVVARINSIRTMQILGRNGEHSEVKNGAGELIDIMYTEDLNFLNF